MADRTTGNAPLDDAIEALQDAAQDLEQARATLRGAQARVENEERAYAAAREQVRLLASTLSVSREQEKP